VNTPLYIAKRYLLSKKSHNLINIITWISVVSVSVGAFALIVVLSVFNGLENLVSDMVNKIAPDVSVTAVKGKTIDCSALSLDKLRDIKGVDFVLPCITEDALFRYDEKQHIGKVLGVPFDYQKIAKMNDSSLMLRKDALFVLGDKHERYAVMGSGVAWYLGINSYNVPQFTSVQVYVPQRSGGTSFSLESGFNSAAIEVSGVFHTGQDTDAQLIIVPLDWLSNLLGYDEGICTEIEIFTKPDANVKLVKKQIKGVLGEGYNVFDQYEQQITLYRMMSTEKWVVYLILTLILVIATFNIVGSLSMLIIDKRKDITLLKTLGADKRFISKLFMAEGMMISVVGGIIGLALGIVMVLIQQHFGIVKLSYGGNYIVNAYPIALRLGDVFLVLVTIVAIGGISTVFTVRRSVRKIKDVRLTAR